MSEKEELENLVKTSNSLSDILRKQGKAISGASMKILKNTLDSYGINYVFLNLTHSTPKIKLTLDEILVKGKNYNSADLRKRLVEEGLKENKCELCGCEDEWNGKPLTLQLDHINGDHYDNRLENLRILCPNCHSQTETFSSRKIKKHNYCIDCGKEISLTSTRCGSCASKHKAIHKVKLEDRPSKEELFNLITSKTFVSIGEMYGVTDNTIRKWCKSYGLPHTKKELRMLSSSNG